MSKDNTPAMALTQIHSDQHLALNEATRDFACLSILPMTHRDVWLLSSPSSLIRFSHVCVCVCGCENMSAVPTGASWGQQIPLGWSFRQT